MSVQTFEMSSAPPAQSAEANLANLLGAIRRRWRVLAGVVGAALVLAILVTAFQKPEYTATSLVMVDWRKDDVMPSQAVRESGGVNPEILDSEIELIRSRGRAKDNGPWVTDWNEMAKKTVFRRLSKWLRSSNGSAGRKRTRMPSSMP